MPDKSKENNNSKEEIDSLKEEVASLKKKKEIESLKAEVNSLKNNKTEGIPTSTLDPAYDELKSRRTTIGILAIFFGFLGVHKFMLGNKTEGFILLGVSIVVGIITCGLAIIITDIIGIIEGIMILNKTPQQFKETYIDNKKAWF